MKALITGMGTIGPWGCGSEALSASLAAGNCSLSAIDRSCGLHTSSSARRAGLVDPGSYREWLAGLMTRRMSVNSRMALAAARMAAKSSEMPEDEIGGDRTAVSIGTSFGSTDFTTRLVEQIQHSGPESASPFLFMETVANAYAGQIAMHFGARGANSTVTHREASGAHAVARALHMLSSGTADRVITGVTDQMQPIPHALLDRFRALARPDRDGAEVARVFDRDRNGCVASEGATVLLLESEDIAKARGANVLGRARCAIRAFDPTAPAHSWGTDSTSATGLARALVRGLEREGLSPADFDRVVSGASGSRDGDRLEGQVLRAAWGKSPLPPVLAPKAVTGEYGGGLLASAVLALGDQPFAAVPGFRNKDPEVGISPHDGSMLARPRRVLLSSLASGGAACWIVLESWS